MKVLFFGAVADITGKREIEINNVCGMSVRETFVQLLSRFPELSRQKLLISVNQQYSNGNEIINDDDELAIFTAVSGG